MSSTSTEGGPRSHRKHRSSVGCALSSLQMFVLHRASRCPQWKRTHTKEAPSQKRHFSTAYRILMEADTYFHRAVVIINCDVCCPPSSLIAKTIYHPSMNAASQKQSGSTWKPLFECSVECSPEIAWNVHEKLGKRSTTANNLQCPLQDTCCPQRTKSIKVFILWYTALR